MRCRFVAVQILENQAQAVAAANFLRRDRAAAIHVDQELGICREKGHLAFHVPAICAVSIRVDKLANGKAIANLLHGEIAMVRLLHGRAHRVLLRSADACHSERHSAYLLDR
jgi:hypothetical protein